MRAAGGYLLVVERTGAERGMSSIEIMVYNAMLSLPPLFLVVLATGELGSGMERLSAMSGDVGFVSVFVLALLAGMLLNYALFLCTLTNSALTTTVVGVLKGVVSTALGFFLLGGVDPSVTHVMGILTNTVGGGVLVRDVQRKAGEAEDEGEEQRLGPRGFGEVD